MFNYDLSFATRSENGTVNYWNTPDTGADLAEEGRRRADELGGVMRGNRDAAIMLPHIARVIGERGAFGPLETAFFHRVAEIVA